MKIHVIRHFQYRTGEFGGNQTLIKFKPGIYDVPEAIARDPFVMDNCQATIVMRDTGIIRPVPAAPGVVYADPGEAGLIAARARNPNATIIQTTKAEDLPVAPQPDPVGFDETNPQALPTQAPTNLEPAGPQGDPETIVEPESTPAKPQAQFSEAERLAMAQAGITPHVVTSNENDAAAQAESNAMVRAELVTQADELGIKVGDDWDNAKIHEEINAALA